MSNERYEKHEARLVNRASHQPAKRRPLRRAVFTGAVGLWPERPEKARSGGILLLLILAACQPKVQIQAPDKPIEINLNVNIEHHVKVEIQKDLDSAMSKQSDIF